MGLIEFRQEVTEDIVVNPVQIPDGIWAEISSVLFAYGASASGRGLLLSPLALRMAAQDLGELLTRHDLNTSYDETVRQLLESHVREFRARAEAERDPSVLSAEDVLSLVRASGRFRRDLTETQIRDLGRLLRLFHGANFSVPGAGKTTTLFAIYEASRAQQLVDSLLVVAPKNAFLSWEDELTACYPDELVRPTIARIVGGPSQAVEVLNEDPEVALITYQFLPNVLDAVKSWTKRHQTHVVLDESHRIKAGTSGVYAFSALQLSGVATRRDVLTGTPMPNSPEDLRAQLEFLWPGQQVLPEQRLTAEESSELLDQVQRSVRPLYMRTTKQELRLPALEVVPVPVVLGPLQRELYELLRSEAKRLAAGFSPLDARLLRRLGAHVLKLLQAASNPLLLAAAEEVDVEGDDGSRSGVWELLKEIARTERPAKITKAIELAENALAVNPGVKVLIWTSFVQNVLALEKLLERYGPVTLYGAIAIGSDEEADTREGRIRRFHTDSGCRVLIANPAACGEGISLHTACHYAIYLDRTFNAAHFLQSIDRIHRLGLAEDILTRVEILEARWTIDARVATRLKAKIDSMSVILNDPGLTALAYDPLDVVEEFPAGIQPEDVEEIMEHIVQGDRDEE
jgi:SNF2 family DNA or RNA helicase